MNKKSLNKSLVRVSIFTSYQLYQCLYAYSIRNAMLPSFEQMCVQSRHCVPRATVCSVICHLFVPSHYKRAFFFKSPFCSLFIYGTANREEKRMSVLTNDAVSPDALCNGSESQLRSYFFVELYVRLLALKKLQKKNNN